MIDTLGLPTIFTHRATDHQWPELAHLICPEDPVDEQARARAVINNAAVADWFFTYRIQRFQRRRDRSYYATYKRHTRCSESYCLHTRNGKQECRFGYPKNLQAQTTINITEEEEPVILTARNDGMLNSFNPIQIISWRANVDMQYIVSRNRVVRYCTKYVTKSET
uniref:Helitron helicase-like domain-containing protein n=1 Tax=Amphimedon queenslandica TaxID=400682 RepID=A0A1X7U2C4_AMPQE